jgi:hypothetical protein
MVVFTINMQIIYRRLILSGEVNEIQLSFIRLISFPEGELDIKTPFLVPTYIKIVD